MYLKILYGIVEASETVPGSGVFVSEKILSGPEIYLIEASGHAPKYGAYSDNLNSQVLADRSVRTFQGFCFFQMENVVR